MNGQITRQNTRGQFLYSLCLRNDINTIVEIGTWYGQGSTKCILDAIVDTNKRLFTLEVDQFVYEQAISIRDKNHPAFNNAEYVHGTIVRSDDLIKSGFFGIYKDEYPQWLQESTKLVDLAPFVLHRIPSTIDLLVLDGGEFSSKKEFELLRDRSKIVFLDDTCVLKNNNNMKWIIASNKYECLIREDQTADHNGWAVYELRGIIH